MGTGYAGAVAGGYPGFRVGSVLSTSFTGTLTERRGARVERIPTPGRLGDWFARFALAATQCSTSDLERAYVLREAIHDAATARALGEALPPDAVAWINEFSQRGTATATLTPQAERCWHLGSPATADTALGVIAADAIEIISGTRPGALALCASPTCRAAFFDTSQSRTRRWCDMNTCGNHAKKARLRARQAAS